MAWPLQPVILTTRWVMNTTYVNESVFRRNAILAGVFSGWIAGVVMALFAMIISAANGYSFWFPMQLVDGVWIGEDALLGGAGVVIAGIITHLVVSAFFGVLFAVFRGRFREIAESLDTTSEAATAFLWGTVYGVGVWVFMTYVVLWLDPTLRIQVFALSPGMWFLYHVVYGAMLFTTPIFQKALSRPYLRSSSQEPTFKDVA